MTNMDIRDTQELVKSHVMRGWLSALRKYKALYVMMIPGLLYLAIYRYGAMYGLTIAFKNYRIARGIRASEWIGLVNFDQLFSSPFWAMVLRNTIIISVYKLAFSFPAPILLALMLNEVGHLKTKRVLQTVMYLPHFLSWVVMGHLVFMMLGPATGMLSGAFRSITGRELNMLINPKTFRGLLVITQIWKSAGWGTIIYLAALTNIDPRLYEAARVDGSKKIQEIWYITIPSIVPVMIVVLFLNLGNMLHAGFQQVLVMQNSYVYEVSEIIETYIYKVAFVQGRYAIASAAGLFQSTIGMILVVGANKLAKVLGKEGFW